MYFGFIQVAREHARRLYLEESGVALMLTLSVILLLYVLCAGVYAYGETARQKMELQNACDSAAYSAAVVQADGLGRMAMINRAMSWTYVQLTNLQLDYITYRWMKKVRDTFREDRQACEDWNEWTCGVSACPDRCLLWSWPPNSPYWGEGKGWFCGVAGEGGARIRMNGRIVDYETLNQYVNSMSSVEGYGETIKSLKATIEAYNAFLMIVNNQMLEAIPATASATLYANLPKEEQGVDASAIARDMLWYVNMNGALSPYNDDVADADLNGATYYRPLYNTETDERIFLTMADSAVYDRLEPYFSNGESNQSENPGLDQWFVRSSAAEASANATSVNPSQDSYMAQGICRVYKNTNRSEFPLIRRGHHVNGTLSMNGLLAALDVNVDVPPSCVHSRILYPEQCATVNSSTSLYADWDWCSFQMHWCCYWRGGKIKYPYHTEFGVALPACDHVCCISPFSHRRSEYKSCFVNPIKYASDAARIAWRARSWTHPANILPELMKNPYGHGRIYGDDKDLYDEATYTGAIAKPWILGPEFFGRKGAIVVGLARKHRNPWAWLMSNMNGSGRNGQAAGIYSAFNPSLGNYIVAFAASRAGFRHRHDVDGAGSREYDPRYDSVCHNDANASRFRLKDGASYVGCVCRDSANEARLKRCWNLCTSDWDAMLLPLAYATADVEGGYYDSYSPNDVSWESVENRSGDEDYANPLEVASALNWVKFVDPDSDSWLTDQSANADSHAQPGGFLSTLAPPAGMEGGNSMYFNLKEGISQKVL